MSTQSSYETNRQKLIESITKEGVTDNRVIKAIQAVPRHLFVPRSLRSSAYENKPLSIGNGQTISQPGLVGLMTQLLDLKGNEKVLEIGTGSGYQTALLSRLARQIYTIERITTLAKRAQRVLGELQYKNVTVVMGDGTQGLPSVAPFDAIIVTAGSPQIPEPLIEQLAEDGRIIIPVGKILQSQVLLKGIKRAGELETEVIEPVRFVPLIGKHGWKTN